MEAIGVELARVWWCLAVGDRTGTVLWWLSATNSSGPDSGVTRSVQMRMQKDSEEYCPKSASFIFAALVNQTTNSLSESREPLFDLTGPTTIMQ